MCVSSAGAGALPTCWFKLFNSRDLWHPKLTSVILQMDELVRLSGFRRPNSTLARSLVARANMFAAQAAALALEQEASDLAESNISWKDWVKMAGTGADSAAHRFVQAPNSISKFDLEGSQMSRSQHLDSEVSQRSSLWKEDAGGQPPVYPPVPLLPPLLPSQLSAASQSFKRATCALGGFHPRHIALLSDSALRALASLLEAAEAAGVLPDQISDILIVLIPMVSGGLRPIGWYHSIFRVWIKSRMHLVKAWEETATANCGFGAEEGKSPIDIVWRHSFGAECAHSTGGFFGCILWDLLKCYEKVDHHLLVAAARRHGYPLAVLRLCIYSYRSPRKIIYNSICSRCILPQCGILAGCSTATSELRLLLLDSARSHRINHPNVNLSVYIDDLALDTSASSAREVVDSIASAALDLAIDLEQRARLPIARSKSAVLANTCATARAIRAHLGDLGGPKLGSVRSLGADFWAANPKFKRSRPIRAMRRTMLTKKTARLKALKMADRHCASRVFFCGATPSVHFDTPIYGLF